MPRQCWYPFRKHRGSKTVYYTSHYSAIRHVKTEMLHHVSFVSWHYFKYWGIQLICLYYKYLFSQSQRAATVRHYDSRYTIISIQEKSDTNAVKRHYNVQLWIVRMVVEQAFGLLKGRFKCLMPTILFRRSHLQVLQIYLQTISIYQ